MMTRVLSPLVFAVLLAFPRPGESQAILNVERLQATEVQGLYGLISGRLNLAEGNVDVFQVGATLGGGLRGEGHWFRAFAGLDRLTKGGKDILDNRYFHLRYNLLLSPRLRTFHFLQLQANEILLLNRRVLLGSGLRARLMDGHEVSLDIGSGIMLEFERLDPGRLPPEQDPEDDVFRMANLLVGSGPLGRDSRWTAVVYHQPVLKSFEDYRLLGELGIRVAVTRFLDLDVAFNWRHDNRAPAGLKEDDVGLKTGLTLRIE